MATTDASASSGAGVRRDLAVNLVDLDSYEEDAAQDGNEVPGGDADAKLMRRSGLPRAVWVERRGDLFQPLEPSVVEVTGRIAQVALLRV